MKALPRTDGRCRVVIENIRPVIDSGHFPIKRIIGEPVVVSADIFADGHDALGAMLLYRRDAESQWIEVPMRTVGNDRWLGRFIVSEAGVYAYTVKGWIDHFATWQKTLEKKFQAGQDIFVELQIGASLLSEASKRIPGSSAALLRETASRLIAERERSQGFLIASDRGIATLMQSISNQEFAIIAEPTLKITVDRKLALFGSWYEFFPRSGCTGLVRHGVFRGCESRLSDIAQMGFDIVYLPPVHPIGITGRKGRNNSIIMQPGDPGSPWAVGSEAGGHKSIDPGLGTIEDFAWFVAKAAELGLEIAMDIAFQCSPDHPYVKEHPEWFSTRPDRTIQCAENPPKRYEDIVPFNFETESWQELWEELKSIFLFWIANGVTIFRVDNPHTKALLFWEWVIAEIKRKYPETIFLAEAFTRPAAMYRLAKLGFTQSYTYFTWRNTKEELTSYLNELVSSEVVEYFRPNFWPNTPDILPDYLQFGEERAAVVRLILAATLSSNYGVYGPALEYGEYAAIPGREEYLESEKYELKKRERARSLHIVDLVNRLNRIRRENPALHEMRNLRFHEVENDYLLFYSKVTADLSNAILVIINLDPFHPQSGSLKVPLDELQIDPTQTYLLQDLLYKERFVWHGARQNICLDPQRAQAGIFRVHRRLHREADFDYY